MTTRLPGAARSAGSELRGPREVSEVVDAERGLEALSTVTERCRTIKPALLTQMWICSNRSVASGGRSGDLAEIGQVEAKQLHVRSRVSAQDLGAPAAGSFVAATGEHRRCTGRSQ